MPIDKEQEKGICYRFQQWVPTYNLETLEVMQWKSPHILASWLNLASNSGRKWLNLGCWTGQFTQYFRKNEFEWTGVDISEEMLEIARQSGHYKKL